MVNGVSEPSPAGSPGASRKGKGSQAATLPAKTQPDAPTSQLEGFLHRKHEWEGHNKKASSRSEEFCCFTILKLQTLWTHEVIIHKTLHFSSP